MIEDFLGFEGQSPSPAHAFRRVQKILNSGKYKPVTDGQWPEEKGYVLMGRAIVAYNVKGNRPGVVFLGQPNKPCFIVRADAERRDGVYNFVNVHRGTTTDTSAWASRDLRLAGFTTSGELYDSNSAVACVPPPSHGFHPEPILDQERMWMPLSGIGGTLKDVVGEDPAGLFFTDAYPARIVGADGQFLCGSGVAGLAGAFVAAKAFGKCQPMDGTCNFLVIYDGVNGFNVKSALEEVASHVLPGKCRIFNDALCVNFGVVPAFHPNFPEASDEENCAVVGGGIAMIDGSELSTRVVVERAAGKLGIPVQKFMEKAGQKTPWVHTPPEFVTEMGMRYAYVGVPTLGINGVRQTVAIRDIDSLMRFAEEIVANCQV